MVRAGIYAWLATVALILASLSLSTTPLSTTPPPPHPPPRRPPLHVSRTCPVFCIFPGRGSSGGLQLEGVDGGSEVGEEVAAQVCVCVCVCVCMSKEPC